MHLAQRRDRFSACVSSENIVGDLGRIGQGPLARELNRGFEFGLRLADDAIELSLADLAAVEHEFFKFDDRAFLLPGLDLRVGTVAGRAEEGLLADYVPLPSVGLALQQRRSVAGPRPRY